MKLGRRIKALLLSFIFAFFGIVSFSAPVYAEPATTETTTETTAENTEETEGEEEQEEQPSCYDQVGNLGWIVCPGTSFLGDVVDNAYRVLTDLINLDPIPNDPESPIRIVWRYFRSITNIVFVLSLSFVLFSQVTGFGISNYHIKKTLPKFVISAILINLSYIICAAGVDLSNITGYAFRSLFDGVSEYAINNGQVSDFAKNFSMGDTISSILGIGAAGTLAIGAAATTYSWAGILYLLIPVVLAGALAVVSALLVMAGRHALIFLLVMISPLAFVCYNLPNMEKWFQKWWKLFTKMIFFFPIFSILYGASKLASIVIITSASGPLMVVIGIAVRVLPLFLTIPLLKMSGTPLAAIDKLVHGTAKPLTNFVGGYAKQGADRAKGRQLNSTRRLPTTHLAQYLAKQRIDRELEIKELAVSNRDHFEAESQRNWYKNRDPESKILSKRGMRHYRNEQRKLENNILRSNIAADYDEGFSESNQYSASANRELAAINNAYGSAIIRDQIAKTRSHDIALKNAERKASNMRDAINNSDHALHNVIRDQIATSFHYDKSPAENTEAARLLDGAVNAVLADAISAKRKVDKEQLGTYLELYDDMQAGMGPTNKLIESIQHRDYNSMQAAIAIMAKRGDHNLIIDTLTKHWNINGDSSSDIVMQKHLLDSLLALKNDNIEIATYAKACQIRRAKSASNATNDADHQIKGFIDLKTFLEGKAVEGDTDTESAKKLTRVQLLEDVNGASTFISADRTMWKQMMKYYTDPNAAAHIELPKDSDLDPAELATAQLSYGMPLKYLRSALSSGQMDGEKLGTAIGYLTMGFDMKKFEAGERQNQFFEDHKIQIKNSLISFVHEMADSQLIGSKSTTIKTINAILKYINNDGVSQIQDSNGNIVNVHDAKNNTISRELLDQLVNQRTNINRESASSARGTMNPEIRAMLGIRV